MSLPNIIFLTIDGLRYDRLGCNGYNVAHTPNIDRLSQEGVSFSNYHTHGSPTQFSFPSIFASSYPLDEGGYGMGILSRSATFTEVLRDAGYWTVGLSLGGALTASNGYSRGFEVYHHLNDITVPVSTAWKNEIAFYRDLYSRGQLNFDHLEQKVSKALDAALVSTIDACAEKIAEIQNGSIAIVKSFHDHDWVKISSIMQNDLENLRKDPKNYVRNILLFDTAENAYKQLPLPLVSRNKFLGSCLNYLNKLLGKCDAKLRLGRQKHMGAREVFESIGKYIDRSHGRPFFLWGHIIDVHDMSFRGGRFMFPPLLKQEFRNIKRAGKEYAGLAAYDYSVSYVDRFVGNLRRRLERDGLDRSTIIIVTSDHGLAANWPRPNVKHVASFYDEHCHVPLIIWGASLQAKRIDRLYGSVDLPATILGMLGLQSPESFRGIDALGEGAAGREYVLMENLGRGPYDLERKSIRLSVRTKDRKYILAEEAGSCLVKEVYDLVSDPSELVNLVESPDEQDGISKFEKLGRDRCAEVRHFAKAIYH